MKNIILVLLFAASIFAQDESILKLFAGKWKMDVANTEIFEEWTVVNDDELIGKSYSVENGTETIIETLYLKKFGEQWAYIAIPSEQSITLFALTVYTPKKLIFENKEHDFPQRISYEFHKGGKMTAAIEGLVDADMKRKEFTFQLLEK